MLLRPSPGYCSELWNLRKYGRFIIIDGDIKSDEKAAEMFYPSALFAALEDEHTKLWHLSAHALFEMFQEELQTGKITYPEEA